MKAPFECERGQAKDYGTCSAHKQAQPDYPTQLMLRITFPNDKLLTLCPLCEILLLQKMLNNYVKRYDKKISVVNLHKDKETAEIIVLPAQPVVEAV